MTLTTPIIPTKQSFAKVDAPHELHLEAICVFAATGFFLDTDTYWKDQLVLPPASKHKINEHGVYESSTPWFKWHYSPRDISFESALEEYTSLFETIVKEQTEGKKVILPLSGGLDSRTQAAAFDYLGTNVYSYSYEFKGGYAETKIAKTIAKVCGFDFKAFTIHKGYLWQYLDRLVELNNCYSDFTTPRQMAIFDKFPEMGNLFSLGHWGDVLFDSFNIPQLTLQEEVDFIFKKIIKRGGLEFASSLWQSWGLPGSFETYLKQRLQKLLSDIAIKNTNAKLRAFKSMYWAPRWTSVNLSIFNSQRPITLPYYDKRMCEFICSVPEAYLNNRQLQIAYIKKRNPKLASITWQDHRPFSLNTYGYNKTPYNLPYKITNKLKRSFKEAIGKPYVQRNWELQFLGAENEAKLKRYLYSNNLNEMVSKPLINDYFKAFKTQPLQNAHAINILLVLSKFKANNHAK